jgi:hypothetical protein
MGALPTRNSLRGNPAAPPKPAAPAPEKAQPAAASKPANLPVPGGDVEEEKSFWEASMGPVGVIVTAIVACGLGYLAFRLFS